MIDGENTLDEEVVTPYFGFYYEDSKILDIANMKNGVYFYFEMVD